MSSHVALFTSETDTEINSNGEAMLPLTACGVKGWFTLARPASVSSEFSVSNGDLVEIKESLKESSRGVLSDRVPDYIMKELCH